MLISRHLMINKDQDTHDLCLGTESCIVGLVEQLQMILIWIFFQPCEGESLSLTATSIIFLLKEKLRDRWIKITCDPVIIIVSGKSLTWSPNIPMYYLNSCSKITGMEFEQANLFSKHHRCPSENTCNVRLWRKYGFETRCHFCRVGILIDFEFGYNEIHGQKKLHTK
jgi:hypothetical protein